MATVLVDSNVLLDVLTEDPSWFRRSASALSRVADYADLALNPIVYAEISVGFESHDELDEAVPPTYFKRLALPWEAAFLAGKCFLQYQRLSGAKRAPLPDFYIGAHAAVMGYELLTRDQSRYQTYFPDLRVIAP
jgi:hypothetical protein